MEPWGAAPKLNSEVKKGKLTYKKENSVKKYSGQKDKSRLEHVKTKNINNMSLRENNSCNLVMVYCVNEEEQVELERRRLSSWYL
jgi:hypothetical protein